MQALLFTIKEACEIAKSGRSALYQAIKAGELRALKRGKRTLILAEDLQGWIKSLPEISAESPANVLASGKLKDDGSWMMAATKREGF